MPELRRVNSCIFCGGPCAEERVYCQDCVRYASDLPPTARKALERLQMDETARAEFRTAAQRLREAIVATIQPAVDALCDWLIRSVRNIK